MFSARICRVHLAENQTIKFRCQQAGAIYSIFLSTESLSPVPCRKTTAKATIMTFSAAGLSAYPANVIILDPPPVRVADWRASLRVEFVQFALLSSERPYIWCHLLFAVRMSCLLRISWNIYLQLS